MPKFKTRIELHAASAEEYDSLHDAMEAAGFSRTITGSNGATYHLPTAEYDFEHDSMTAAEVRERAAAAAKTIKKDPAVLVTMGTRSWQGLAKR